MQSSTQILTLSIFFEKVETIIINILDILFWVSMRNSKFYPKVYMILEFEYKENKERTSLFLAGTLQPEMLNPMSNQSLIFSFL